jgi:hypothetical protein
VGDTVVTPTGAHAEVMNIYPKEREALVVWTTGDRARFKLSRLKKV